MARDATRPGQPQAAATGFDAAMWLEAHGLLHEYGDGRDHCDNWTARHWSTGRFIECANPRCKCVLRC